MSSENMPLLAIFDHDGVLVDTLALHQDAWVEHGRRSGIPITREYVLETFGMTNPSLLRRILGESLEDAVIAAHTDGKEACYRELAAGKIALMDGVRELLDGLTAAGVKLAIGSSGVRGNLELTARDCGLEGRFAAMAALEDIKHGKPDPEVFLVAASRAGVEPSRAVVFEDAPVGVRAAKAAGMYAVAITSTHPAAPLREAGADEVVETLRGYDVAALIRRLHDRSPGVVPGLGPA
ncbi:Phosphorylated carbohydrates phosphatase [Aquisphaera giovannonii]|uniref:Phosphorylated carbohydrates phosphatase n=1 Tax=Aquisphaera giovannonii TaxID=406548 RepID=A0A5B9W9G7_9BACT|nr:HAD family phosphatase [Aquisphaera giovannonii]QEH36721.1 Phosphorylated carbohydrates phosphatase [Aquisphaera giovannonii]